MMAGGCGLIQEGIPLLMPCVSPQEERGSNACLERGRKVVTMEIRMYAVATASPALAGSEVCLVRLRGERVMGDTQGGILV